MRVFLFSSLFLFYAQSASTACPTNFYAEPTSLETVSKLAFYHIKKDINSVSECAKMCGRIRFCRTAVYDTLEKTCGFSWTWHVDCLSPTQRFNTYNPGAANETMSLIACVDYCNKTTITRSSSSYQPRWKPLEILTNEITDDLDFTNIKDPNFHVNVRHLSSLDEASNVQLVKSDSYSLKEEGVITQPDKDHKKVMVMPQPLTFEGITNGTSKSYGLDRTESDDTVDEKKIEQKAGDAVVDKEAKAPAQLVTISPDEFARSTEAPVNVFTTKGKFQVSKDTQRKHYKMNGKQKSSREMMDMLLKEPVLINGRMLHPRVAMKLFEYEMTSTTPLSTSTEQEEGFVNTFLIEGVSNMFREALAARQKILKEHANNMTLSKIASPPPACYRAIPQQSLMPGPFKVLDGRVTKNDCRCACASTWKDPNPSNLKCRSLQYYETTQRCALNTNDHSGKYDLVFDKTSEYNYVSCNLQMLLEAAEIMCSKKTIDADSSTPSQIIEQSATTPEPKMVTKNDSDSDPRLFEEILHYNTTEEPKNLEIQLEKKEVKVVANKTEPVDIFVTSYEVTTLKPTTVFGMVAITDELPETEKEVDGSKNVSVSGNETTTGKMPSTPEASHGGTMDCFEYIEGHMMSSTAGGLERGLTIKECQCLCANSRASHKYPFQCLSATYYHYDMACILHMSNRQLMPKSFIKIPTEEANTTYLGMICTDEKARQILVNNTLEYGCLLSSTYEAPATKLEEATTTIAPSTSTASETDACFLELPNYVLEGNALAVETNVSVEECKCYCIDAPYRYGSDCQSVQYYYDSETCLINKENRLTNPDKFSFDPQTGIMQSYFDYQCNSERMILSVYVEQICEQIVEMNIKDIVGPPGDPEDDSKSIENDTSAASNDEDSEEEEMVEDEGYKGSETENTSDQKSTNIQDTNKADEEVTTDETTTISKTIDVTTKETMTVNTTTESIQTTMNATKSSKEVHDKESSKKSPSITTTTEEPTTEESTDYPPVGPCRYSALYQTIFNGARMLKRLMVTSPHQCFAACHAEGCRSANLVQYEGAMKYCELFRDSIVDFRRTDVLSFDRSAVHFDSIRCEDAE